MHLFVVCTRLFNIVLWLWYRLQLRNLSFHGRIISVLWTVFNVHVFQSASCSGLLCSLLRATPLSLRLGARRYVFYRDTPRRKLLPEPLATQLFCLPRMVKLPLDYFSKHFACPLAGFVRAENPYNFAPLRTKALLELSTAACHSGRTYVEYRLRIYIPL